MTPEIRRLKRRAEFQAVARLGRKWVMPGVVVQAMKRGSARNADIPDTVIRTGFTASRRVGGAVVRNRAKRRLRALARELLPGGCAGGYDVVFIARGGMSGRDHEELKADMAKCLKKLGVTS